MKEMKYDTKKAPLGESASAPGDLSRYSPNAGKLTTGQLKLGYAALQKIERLINKSVKGDSLVRACDEFYTRVPHDFGQVTVRIQ